MLVGAEGGLTRLVPPTLKELAVQVEEEMAVLDLIALLGQMD
jgi:hypothetical protein